MKAFLFDLDGTLVDRNSGAENWLQEKFQPRFLPSSWDGFTARFHQLDLECRRDKPRLFNTLTAEFDLGASGSELVADYRESVWRYCELFPEVKPPLQTLAASGFRLAIVSNGTTVCQGAKIAGLGLENLVDFSLISEIEGLRKPDPQLFLRAAERLQVPPEQCFVVGDSVADDIAGGAAAGMKTIWIEQEGGWPAGLPIYPDFMIQSLSDLPNLGREHF